MVDVKMGWYAVQTMSGEELKVKSILEKKISESNFIEYFGEVMVPTEEVFEMKNGKKRRSERKFFPGYVLINMSMTEEAWHFVRSTPKVLGFTGGTSDKPAAIKDAQMQQILSQVEAGVNKPRPKILFEAGEIVRVIEGPFADFNGTVEEVDYDKHKLKVAVSIFGRSTPVNLEFGQVEKL